MSVCDGGGVFGNGPDGLPSGSLGIAGAFVACAAGALLAYEVGFDAGTSVLVALAAALLLSAIIKINVDMRTAKFLGQIADGDIEVDAAPDAIRARLASRPHRENLARTLRKIADDARRYPLRQGLLAPPPIILHFEPETRRWLVHLAEVLESDTPLEPRGVAVVEELISNPASPVFGSSGGGLSSSRFAARCSSSASTEVRLAVPRDAG